MYSHCLNDPGAAHSFLLVPVLLIRSSYIVLLLSGQLIIFATRSRKTIHSLFTMLGIATLLLSAVYSVTAAPVEIEKRGMYILMHSD